MAIMFTIYFYYDGGRPQLQLNSVLAAIRFQNICLFYIFSKCSELFKFTSPGQAYIELYESLFY